MANAPGPETSASTPLADEDVHLPDNAFRELAPGETYEPVVPASAQRGDRPMGRPAAHCHAMPEAL